jgi:hypothetical protein
MENLETAFKLSRKGLPKVNQTSTTSLISVKKNFIVKSIELKLVEGFFPDSRSYFICEPIREDEIFIHGGANKKKEYCQIDIFEADTNQWKQVTEISTVDPFFIFDKILSGHTSSRLVYEGNSSIVVYGGYDGKNYSNAIYIIEIDNFQFNQIDVRGKGTSEYPLPRSYHTSNYEESSNSLYVFGGWNGNIGSLYSQNFLSLWKFDFKCNKNIY